ncbi:NAD(P)H-hydrate dehydratase [Rhodobacteraceae bacterium RKSG542]|nr:NAD(P)H-hydrate dehydratase [Pseudovibrio flavus]MTI16699.1 NAD(P)H-hydrate dehydratase [Pseudovibrio flavus]
MGHADKLTIDSGTPGISLMEEAGRGVASAVCRLARYTSTILVLAGPGNNGGDGFVAARHLRQRGYRVEVALLGDPSNLRGDAQLAFEGMGQGLIPSEDVLDLLKTLNASDVVVDALFGAGLSRSLDGLAAQWVNATNDSLARVVAVDLPSGLDGRTGQVQGCAIDADISVSFFRAKPGHYLYPGRELKGNLEICDIGIRPSVLPRLGDLIQLNSPRFWQNAFPVPKRAGHKFERGHMLVMSGSRFRTGASRLAAYAGQRVGLGLVTVAAEEQAALIHAAHFSSIMVAECNQSETLEALLSDPRYSSVVIGPAAGIGEKTRHNVSLCLSLAKSVLLDADALTSFEDSAPELFELIDQSKAQVIMTPHGGEFHRIFPDLSIDDNLSKVEKAREAAIRSGAVVVLKGADTVIASPKGHALINYNGTPWLATAGSGDVLAGICGGLLGQGMDAFEAAACAVWSHARAAEMSGICLTAEDLIAKLPFVINEILEGEAPL